MNRHRIFMERVADTLGVVLADARGELVVGQRRSVRKVARPFERAPLDARDGDCVRHVGCRACSAEVGEDRLKRVGPLAFVALLALGFVGEDDADGAPPCDADLDVRVEVFGPPVLYS